jgi:hypothetical protein
MLHPLKKLGTLKHSDRSSESLAKDWLSVATAIVNALLLLVVPRLRD